METSLAIRTREAVKDPTEPSEPDPLTPSDHDSPSPDAQNDEMQSQSTAPAVARPPPQGVTEPYPPALLNTYRSEMSHSRPRNRSPYARSHLRSYSAASSLSAPPMARTRSLPNTAAAFTYSPSHSPVRSSSPLRSPPNSRLSPRRSLEERREPSTPTFFMDIESIAEDSELDITPRGGAPSNAPPFALPYAHTIPLRTSSSSSNTPSSRRQLQPSFFSPTPQSYTHRPQSPLNSPPSGTTSRFNETYPQTTPAPYATSSVPSTPTSLRSRSPSISSLETIPDSPDAEEAAIEAFNIAKLRAAAEAADRESGSDSDGERKTRSSSTSSASTSSSSSRGTTDKSRKRWSVSGAERRGDLEMETIWED